MGIAGPEGIASSAEIPRHSESKKARLMARLCLSGVRCFVRAWLSDSADFFSGIDIRHSTSNSSGK